MNTVLVTGSSRGVGRGIAEAFARNKDKVVLNCLRRTDEMNAVRDTMLAYNPDIMAIQADVSDYGQCEAMFREIEARFGPADVLVNNAGVAYAGLFNTMEPAEYERLIRVNLTSVMHCCRLALGPMVRRQRGCIINISSVWGEAGASCEAVYSATKAGVNGFTKALAKELGPCGIRINAIACGFIDTEMNDHLDQDEKNALADEIPLGRLGMPGDVAGLACFLASDAASYITGQIIGVNGGWH